MGRRTGTGVRGGTSPGSSPDALHYWPRGVALVIAPWNFPMAILTGMVSAALVTGNTVIMKPAEQAAVCGAMVMEMFEEAGVPPGVLNFLPGKGRVIGQHLVDHKDVHMIAFTGSREVGLRIWESAGKTLPGQLELKRVVCEMGGKNAVIIDSDADLDEAIVDSIYSAFGYQGQKCSALSRLIVLEENYDRVIKRLVEAAASLRVGNPETPGIMVGPVIDETAYRRMLETIEAGKKEATLAFQGTVPPEGFFVPPTIFTDVKPTMRLSCEEIFGPVLSVIRVRDLDEAIRVANDTDYALTAGFFSAVPRTSSASKRNWSRAMFTSIAPAPAPSSAAIPSADSRCRAAERKPAAAITCSNSWSPASSPKTSCATASPRIRRRSIGRRLGRESRIKPPAALPLVTKLHLVMPLFRKLCFARC